MKTAGFYEPTSPPVVSDKILVVAGAVIDNYSTEEPSGVIRGFDVHTGKLVWAWDSGAADENALPSPTHHLHQQLAELLDHGLVTIRSLAWSTCRWA